MTWTQNYDPFGSAVLSPLAAAVPVVLLLGLLASGRVSAPFAALAGLGTAIVVAVYGFTPAEAMTPLGPGRAAWARTVFTAAGYGAAFGLLPIGWIVLNAVFLYALTVETGSFETVKRSVLALSDDRRVQALLIAFSFGAFLEGAAGFGTPVAVSAALLFGAGFRPLDAAVLSLLANTAPVAFGALGTPITTLAKVTGLDELKLSAMAGRQLPFFSLLVPAWLVWVMAGWRGVLGVWPAVLVSGGTFAAVQFAMSNYHGPWLVDVVAGVVSLVSLALLLRVWKPSHAWRFADEPNIPEAPTTPLAPRAVVAAWVPWVLLTAFVFAWGLPVVKSALKPTTRTWEVPGLHAAVVRTPPVVAAPQVEEAKYDFAWLSATGTGIFLAAVASAVWLRMSPAVFTRVWLDTVWRLRWPLVTIAAMLAIAFTTRYSGMDATLGLAFTRTGAAYPVFAALLGWLGVALTGSDTASNAMFGGLQTITASHLAGTVLPLDAGRAAILLAAANSSGGVMGKMIDAQSIVVAAAATGHHGQEGSILRSVFGHSLTLAFLVGLLVLLQAYVWTAAVP
ncbi:MAG TPA: lactate permease LctP family transporter [Gemmataceae bacterium]|jgi:lactate permease